MTRAPLLLRASLLALPALLSVGCGTDPGGDEPAPPPSHRPQVAVILALSPGVEGTPTGSDSIVVDSGAVVAYDYRGSSGFEAPQVWLDSLDVPNTGSFVARHRHVLVAASDSISVSLADSGMIRAARDILDSPEPYAAYVTYQLLADSLRQAEGPGAGVRRLNAIEAAAFHPVADALRAAAVMPVIADSLRGNEGGNTNSVRAASPTPEVTFLFVNGIWTPSSGYAATVAGPFTNLVYAAGYTDPLRYSIGGFYNSTASVLSPSTWQEWFCFLGKARLLLAHKYKMLAVLPPCIPGQASDLLQSALQVMNAVYNRLPGTADPEVLAFADSVERILKRGTRVVLLAHSQGNLYAQQALAAVSAGPLGHRIGCVATVGIAPPTSVGWPIAGSSLGQYIAEGVFSKDILLHLPIANTIATRPRTTLTNYWDQVWIPVKTLLLAFGFLTGTGSAPSAALEVYSGLTIHDFDHYGFDPLMSGLIPSEITRQVVQGTLRCPPPNTIAGISGNGQIGPAGQPLPLPLVARVVDSAGNGVPGIEVTFAVTGGGGTVGGATQLVLRTDEFGEVRVAWTLGSQPGANRVDATAANDNGTPLNGSPVVFTAVAGVPTWSVGGAVSGLTGSGLVLQNNGGDDLAITTNGTFAFATRLPSGTSYAVTVSQQPNGQVCSISGSVGTISSADVTSVDVTCVGLWGVGGTTTGLASPGLVLRNNGADDLPIVANGTFRFATPLPDRSPYAVTVRDQPSGQVCTVTNGTGVIGGAEITDVRVTCGSSSRIEVMNDMSCALRPSGAAWCWGDNSEGKFGDGTRNGGVTPRRAAAGLLLAAIDLAASGSDGHHACGLTLAGVAYCWGNQYDGQLGNGQFGDTTDVLLPSRVATSLTFSVIEAGDQHSCAITGGGAAYCWGSNHAGQVGDGTTVDRGFPVAVSGGLTLAALVSGDNFTCALNPQGKAYCWGQGNQGQLGNGGVADVPSPVAVTGGHSFSELAAFDQSVCGLNLLGVAICWGAGNPLPAPVPTSLRFSTISAGYEHACGITPAGAAYCWGSNEDGQLGTGTSISGSATPVSVAGGLLFTRIAAGEEHTCAVTIGDEVYCWGLNRDGMVGPGVPLDQIAYHPVRVPVP